MNKQEAIIDDIDDDIDSEDDFEESEKRIADILVLGERIEDLPDVSLEMLEKYFQYLSQNLPDNLLLTGQESMGHFAWEEKFDFGYGSQKEYDQLRKQKASYHDKFKLLRLKNIDPSFGIIAAVSRISDNKKFDIPLADLEACDENAIEYVVLEDYSMWFVNYNGEWV